LIEQKNKLEDRIRNLYKALCDIDNRYIKSEDITIICNIPFLKQPQQVVSDTLSQEIKMQIERKNMDISVLLNWSRF
jgi:hypothetical protein